MVGWVLYGEYGNMGAPFGCWKACSEPSEVVPRQTDFYAMRHEGCCVAVEATLARYQDASAALTWPGGPNSKTPRRSSSGAQCNERVKWDFSEDKESRQAIVNIL